LLEEEILILDSDLSKVEKYLTLWREWNHPGKNNTFLKSYNSEKCYELEGNDFTFSPADYRLDSLGKGSHIWWNEKMDQVMLDFKFDLVEVAPASTKWVKKRADRNCLSADPNDCLVWCLIEVPAKVDTVIIQEAKLGCLDGFFLNKNELECDRTIISEEKVESELQVKVMDLYSEQEIRIKEFKMVECK